MEVPTQAAIHTVFVRRHNKIADALARVHGHRWSEERLYQEAKRIVIAELQQITYNEYLPRVLGRATMRKYKLNSPHPDSHPLDLFEDQYDKTIDPSISNSFSAAAFRFGHSQIRNTNFQIGPSRNRVVLKHFLEDLFDNPDTHYNYSFPGGPTDAFVRWMAQSFSSHTDGTFADSVRNHLFRCDSGSLRDCNTGGGATTALDLPALNIQRGRDHGLPGYTKWRHWCSRKRTLSFRPVETGLGDHSPFEANILKRTYR